jgi:hypothetical protein
MTDAIAAAVDDGAALWLGVVAPTDGPPAFRPARDRIRRLWRELGFGEDLLPRRVVPTPACGLAGASPELVRQVLPVLRDLGHDLVDPVRNHQDVGTDR